MLRRIWHYVRTILARSAGFRIVTAKRRACFRLALRLERALNSVLLALRKLNRLSHVASVLLHLRIIIQLLESRSIRALVVAALVTHLIGLLR